MHVAEMHMQPDNSHVICFACLQKPMCEQIQMSLEGSLQVMVHVTEEEHQKVAVHCHAGLGRTG